MRSHGLPDKPRIYVHTDHNPDEVRSFFEIPEALVRRFWAESDERTFTQALADVVPAFDPYLLRDEYAQLLERYEEVYRAVQRVLDTGQLDAYHERLLRTVLGEDHG